VAQTPDDGGWVTGDYDMLPAPIGGGMRNSGRRREREITVAGT
jgi:hypothetical protein